MQTRSPAVRHILHAALQLQDLRDLHGERCIPVDVFDRSTCSVNLRAVRRAREWLRDGHCVAVFPAGEVSRRQRERHCVSDPPWSHLAARFVFGSQADAIPVLFHRL